MAELISRMLHWKQSVQPIYPVDLHCFAFSKVNFGLINYFQLVCDGSHLDFLFCLLWILQTGYLQWLHTTAHDWCAVVPASDCLVFGTFEDLEAGISAMLIFVDFCGFWIYKERTLACLMFVFRCHNAASQLCGILITLTVLLQYCTNIFASTTYYKTVSKPLLYKHFPGGIYIIMQKIPHPLKLHCVAWGVYILLLWQRQKPTIESVLGCFIISKSTVMCGMHVSLPV